MDSLTHPADGQWIAIEHSSAQSQARRAALTLAERLGFSEARAGEVAIAATELATNLARHAQKGVLLVRAHREAGEGAVELISIDSGPGFSDVSVLLDDGYSTRGSLGIGMGAIRRLANSFDAYSVPQRGTVIASTYWRMPGAVQRRTFAAVTRPIHGETACGDAWSVRDQGTVRYFMLVDGLGHGELAAMAAREAVRSFELQPDLSDVTHVVSELDRALRSSRGAALALLALDRNAETSTFTGIGNISAFIDDGERRAGFLSTPGIAGSHRKATRAVSHPFPAHAIAVMHSDGLTTKWDMHAYPGLRARDPLVIAATLFRDAAVHHDDASVIVA